MTSTPPWRRTAHAAGLLDPAGVLSPTIFAEMSALAVELGAINLGQGYPDEDPPPTVAEAARDAIARGVNQYPPGRGTEPLRKAVAAHQSHWYGLEWDPNREVLVTAGATEALAATLLAFVEAGDEVVVIEPFYDAYAAVVGLAGGRLVPIPARPPSFLPDPDRLVAAVTDRTAIILLNTPHNPTGAVLPDDTIRLALELAERHDALVVTDEVYEHLVFTGRHRSLAEFPGGRERGITISSAAKTLNVTGWKIGWVTARPDLIDAVLTVKQYLTYVNGRRSSPRSLSVSACRTSSSSRRRVASTGAGSSSQPPCARLDSRCTTPPPPTSRSPTPPRSALRTRSRPVAGSRRSPESSRSRSARFWRTRPIRPAGRWSGSQPANATE